MGLSGGGCKMTRYGKSHRRGFTLMELVVSMSVTAVLMGGLASAIVLASRAIPDAQSPSRGALDGYHMAEQIVGELYCAQSFTERTATAIQFTVADRNADAVPETIRYAWSGTLGDPLTRSYNGSVAVDVLLAVHEFNMGYGVETLTETTTQEITAWSEPAVLASFSGWGGVSAEPRDHAVNVSYWESQHLVIVPPEGVTQLKITHADVMVWRGASVPQGLTLGIHRPLGDGSYEPDPMPIGTPATIPGTDIEMVMLWKQAAFSDVLITDPTKTDYCLVVKGIGTTPASIHYLYSKNAPDNGIYQRWTSDGGGSWDPRANQLNQQDIYFNVYGSFFTTGQQEITTQRYFLRSARIALRVGPDPSARVETAVQVLNAPEVMSP